MNYLGALSRVRALEDENRRLLAKMDRNDRRYVDDTVADRKFFLDKERRLKAQLAKTEQERDEFRRRFLFSEQRIGELMMTYSRYQALMYTTTQANQPNGKCTQVLHKRQ